MAIPDATPVLRIEQIQIKQDQPIDVIMNELY
jgi:hypothetical protein